MREREDRDWQRAAFVAAHIINVSGKTVKTPVHPEDLLGRKHERRKRLDERVRAERPEEG